MKRTFDLIGLTLVLLCNYFWICVYTIIPVKKQKAYHKDFSKWTLNKIKNGNKPKRIYPRA